VTGARRQHAAVRARALWVLAVLLFVGGAVAVAWLVAERDRLYGQLENEADLRGNAVSTLAGDVRALREQVKAEGKTPVAPDPTKAVENLPARAEVPVPIPGPAGPTGARGATGPAGKDGTNGSPGVNGVPGQLGPTGPAGATGPQGDPGPAGSQGEPGPAGPAGPAGADGQDGKDGQTCPTGYSLQAPSYDPDALVCRRDGSGQPSDSDTPTTQSLALDPQRRQYA
jgi:hypothetical protein